MRARSLLVLLIGSSALTAARPVEAQIEVRALLDSARAAQPAADAGPRALELPRVFRAPGTRLFNVLVELPPAIDPRSVGLTGAAPGFAALEASPDAVEEFARKHPDWTMTWSPPRRPLLDKAAQWVRAPHLTPGGPRGRGVVVGIVDTGIDPAHFDLRDEQGKSRVRWLLDFSRGPAALHPELEAEYGCTERPTCAIYDNADLDELNQNSVDPNRPQDTFGHGTHVASLAAGNGLSSVTQSTTERKYVGMAPEATVISVRATRENGGSLLDPDILRATRFIFEQAERLGMPAVVNLSLGSEFGSHDGSAALERGLAALLEPDRPGRSIVVAAGNSGGVYPDLAPSYPSPAGIHTELHVPHDSDVRVPLLTPPSGQATTSGRIYVWIAVRPGDGLEVGVDDADDEIIAPVEPGHARSAKSGDLEVSVNNDTHGERSQIASDTHAAVVILDGSWKSGVPFAIRLRGHGTASLWVQSDGEAGPEAGNIGVLFPGAFKAGTISVPASHPLLIAAGATLNRLTWPVHTGKDTVTIDQLGSVKNPPLDSMAYFSGAGPNATGAMKPDIVAPGAFVVGAMSHSVDPRLNGGRGLFAATENCLQPDGGVLQCLVTDAWHGVASGTSMAAPIVSGAIALLLEQDHGLTQRQIIDLLQGGARRPEGLVPVEEQLGPGALDIEGALMALAARKGGVVREPSLERSWLSLASSFVRPDPEWPLIGVVQLRDANGAPADNFGIERLRLDAAPAIVKDGLRRAGPGLFRFSIAAPAGSGGQRMRLRVLLDERVLAERDLPIAVDRAVADHGVDARGGCAFAFGAGTVSAPWIVAVLGLLARRIRRRAQSLER